MSATTPISSERRGCQVVARRATNDSARDVRAADLKQTARAQRAPAPAASCVQEEVVKPTRERSGSATQRFSPDPTKTAATNEHRSERSEQSNTAPVARA
jgi:hypothetical protein